MTLQQIDIPSTWQPESRPSLETVKKSQRDLRIDFFRGAALLMIFVDHVEWGIGTRLVGHYTLQGIGFSDAAEVFVFISGYVFGIVYERIRQKSGYVACQLKALRRIGQIYMANLLSLWMVVLIVGLLTSQGAHSFGRLSLPEESHEPLMAVALAMGLLDQPFGFMILPVYMVILLMMPLLLVLLRWNICVAFLVSGSLYAATQIVPSLNLPASLAGTGWLLNPFAWQFLFFLGMALSVHLETGDFRIPRSRLLIGLCVLGLALALGVRKIMPSLAEQDVISFSWWQKQFGNPFPMTAKTTLGPMRLLHFFLLTYLVSILLPRTSAFWKSALAWPLVLCGQHSLPVFCLGVILTYVGFPLLFTFRASPVALLLLEAFGCLILVLSSVALQKLDQSRRRHQVIDNECH